MTVDLSKTEPPILVSAPDVETVGTLASWATFSKDRVYRYALGRMWDDHGSVLIACLLNPSTADEEKLDPTLRRVRAFAERDGYGGMVVVNAFAFRSTDKKALTRVDDPVGPHNDTAICAAVDRPLLGRAVAGWGRPDNLKIAERFERILVLPMRRSWFMWSLTKGGFPRHPLYLAKDTPIVKWVR